MDTYHIAEDCTLALMCELRGLDVDNEFERGLVTELIRTEAAESAQYNEFMDAALGTMEDLFYATTSL